MLAGSRGISSTCTAVGFRTVAYLLVGNPIPGLRRHESRALPPGNVGGLSHHESATPDRILLSKQLDNHHTMHE